VASYGFLADPFPDADEAHGSGCVAGGNELPDGIWFGFATSVTADTVTLDLACFWTGEAADAAAIADGAEPLGFHVRNENPTTRTMARDASGTAYWLDGAAAEIVPLAIPMVDWPVIVGAAYQECPSDHCAVWLYINDGVVTELVEQYLP
jgi:hypothetical protein